MATGRHDEDGAGHAHSNGGPYGDTIGSMQVNKARNQPARFHRMAVYTRGGGANEGL